jgi:hypothetical protein
MIFIKLKNWKNKITFKTATEDLQAATNWKMENKLIMKPQSCAYSNFQA